MENRVGIARGEHGLGSLDGHGVAVGVLISDRHGIDQRGRGQPRFEFLDLEATSPGALGVLRAAAGSKAVHQGFGKPTGKQHGTVPPLGKERSSAAWLMGRVDQLQVWANFRSDAKAFSDHLTHVLLIGGSGICPNRLMSRFRKLLVILRRKKDADMNGINIKKLSSTPRKQVQENHLLARRARKKPLIS